MANTDYGAWRARLSEANDPAFWPIEAIDKELIEGRAQFWCDGTAALVTRIVSYPGGAVVLDYLAASGDLSGLLENIQPQTIQFAKDNGLTHRFIAGRAGWQRVFKDWQFHQIILVKEID